jgi:hypothetical protein
LKKRLVVVVSKREAVLPKFYSLIVSALLLLAATTTGSQEGGDFVQKALGDPGFEWRSLEARGARIYYTPGSFAEKHRFMLLRSTNASIDEVVELLGESDYGRLLSVFYVESREEMERLVGRPVTGFSNWTASGIFLVVNPEWRSFEKHEIAHIITLGVWGWPEPTSRWMVEGICIYVDGWCREYSVDEIAYQYLSDDRLPPLQELFEKFAELGEIRAGVYAASVIGFVRDTYGVDAVRALWTDGSGDLKKSIGVPAGELEALWKEHLRRAADDDLQIDLKTIEELGCG